MINFTRNEYQSISIDGEYALDKFKFTIQFESHEAFTNGDYLTSLAYNGTNNWGIYESGGLQLYYANINSGWTYRKIVDILPDTLYNITIEYDGSNITINCNGQEQTYKDNMKLNKSYSHFLLSQNGSYNSNNIIREDLKIYKVEMLDLSNNKIALKYDGNDKFTSELYDNCNMRLYGDKDKIFNPPLYVKIDDDTYNFSDETHNDSLLYVPYLKYDNLMNQSPSDDIISGIYECDKNYKNCLDYLSKHSKKFRVMMIKN